MTLKKLVNSLTRKRRKARRRKVSKKQLTLPFFDLGRVSDEWIKTHTYQKEGY